MRARRNSASNSNGETRLRLRLGCKSPNAVTAFPIGLLRAGASHIDDRLVSPGRTIHGLMTVMPAARKGASSRVATLKRRDAAMAAIWASATAIRMTMPASACNNLRVSFCSCDIEGHNPLGEQPEHDLFCARRSRSAHWRFRALRCRLVPARRVSALH